LILFVDSSIWFAAIVARDAGYERAKTILKASSVRVITDYVLVETWLLLNSRYRREAAERFWADVRRGAARVEFVLPADIEGAWATGKAFPDQDFSIVDRTSFAVMERLGIRRVASFDDDVAVYRYGRGRDKAFEVIR
jgi:predicted nucleic acid-binding protein